jgi:hypothetical protein
MGQSNCGRLAAASGAFLLGLSPALPMDRVLDRGGFDSEPALGVAAAGPCPTRFDYLVLASFADTESLLGLSSYRFRSAVGFSTVPLTGSLRVDYRVESSAADCRFRGMSHRPFD